MYKAYIFDFDYTLGDSTDGIVQSVLYALEKLQEEPKSTEKIRKTIGLSLKETYFTLTGSDNEEKAELFANYFKEKADEVMVDSTQIYEPVKEVLASLREKGCRVGIVTTKYHYRINAILAKFDMNDMVDIIVGGEDVKTPKPNPEGLLFAIRQLQLEKADILYVGDSIVDAKTAEAANVDFAGVLTGTTGAEDLAKYRNVCIAENLYGLPGQVKLSAQNTTLCYIEQDDKYLMLHRVKKVNDQNHDKWIGVGGKFEDGESPEDCLLREVKEETGLTLKKFFYRGIVTFVSDKCETEYMHLFTATEYEGELQACDEGELVWVPKADIEKLNLWEGDKVFFHLIDESKDFFSLKLRYEGEHLVGTVVTRY